MRRVGDEIALRRNGVLEGREHRLTLPASRLSSSSPSTSIRREVGSGRRAPRPPSAGGPAGAPAGHDEPEERGAPDTDEGDEREQSVRSRQRVDSTSSTERETSTAQAGRDLAHEPADVDLVDREPGTPKAGLRPRPRRSLEDDRHDLVRGRQGRLGGDDLRADRRRAEGATAEGES